MIPDICLIHDAQGDQSFCIWLYIIIYYFNEGHLKIIIFGS